VHHEIYCQEKIYSDYLVAESTVRNTKLEPPQMYRFAKQEMGFYKNFPITVQLKRPANMHIQILE